MIIVKGFDSIAKEFEPDQLLDDYGGKASPPEGYERVNENYVYNENDQVENLEVKQYLEEKLKD